MTMVMVLRGSQQLFKLQGISSARGVLKSQPFQRYTRHRDKGGLVPVATGTVLSSTDAKSARPSLPQQNQASVGAPTSCF
jgi:hypothetical protein